MGRLDDRALDTGGPRRAVDAPRRAGRRRSGRHRRARAAGDGCSGTRHATHRIHGPQLLVLARELLRVRLPHRVPRDASAERSGRLRARVVRGRHRTRGHRAAERRGEQWIADMLFLAVAAAANLPVREPPVPSRAAAAA